MLTANIAYATRSINFTYQRDKTCASGLIWNLDWSVGLTQGVSLITDRNINNIYVLLTS